MNFSFRYKGLGVILLFWLFLNFILTKIFFRKARLIRLPYYLRIQGDMELGKGFSANSGLVIDVYGKKAKLVIGENVMANYRLHIGVCEEIYIGDNTLFGSDCLIIDHSHGIYGGDIHSSPQVAPQKRELISSAISIGSNCWFGDKVSIMPGVKIGNGVVVGANSVVTKDLSSNVIAAGSPARIIKRYDINLQKWLKV
jgi:lipopolysaccharide O-acetyltransferase|tara:strand:+ start:2391 stop:2984 length:594 start_codon:yes stop_codon:yes gene_type:complete